MKIEYPIKGITLDVNDLIAINKYYEAACTAEYLMQSYHISNEDEAMYLGYRVREEMYKYDYTEAEAIEIIMKEEETDNDEN